MRLCENCGKKTKNRRFCKRFCYDQARKPIPRPCENCDKEFSPSQSARRFCSQSCAASRNNVLSPKRTPTTRKPCLLPGCTAPVSTPKGEYCGSGHSATHKRVKYLLAWLSGEAIAGDLIREGNIIREYLYAMQNNTCALCPQGREWNGSALNFIMDHIDGNSSDSSRGNLRLVCPNCDFQLPTSKGRNRGRGRLSRREARAASRL